MRIAVETRGTGEPAWLVHGLGASRDHLYAVADALPYASRLPDLRGHGDSEGGPVGALADFAEDLVPLVAKAPGPVAGLSMGALVAMDLWARLPQLPAVVLVDPLLDASELWTWAGTYERLISPYRERDLDRLVALMDDHPLTKGLGEAQRRQNARSHLQADEATISSALRAMGGEPAWRRPEGAEGRFTIVRATGSIACPLPAAQAVAAAVGGEVREIDSLHCASLDAPQALADALRVAF